MISPSPAAFPDYIPLIAVAVSAAVKTYSSLNVSLSVCHELMSLQDLKDLQSILSIAKGLHSHLLECYRQNP